MCGRSSLTKTEKELEQRFEATFYSEDIERYNPLPNFNFAPTHLSPIITSDDPSKFRLLRWGLVPHWAKEEKIGYKMINSRIETIIEKSTYAAAFAKRRCLVPMDGFYEWKKDGKSKIPFRIQTADQEIYSVAGMWEAWKIPNSGVWLYTYTIITLPANQFMASLHDRMPAILLKENEKNWIDPLITPKEALSLLVPYPSEAMSAYRVSDKVGNVREVGAELILPV